MKIKTELRKGTNDNIPWENNTFDYLVSWNVIHYESSESGMLKAIKEYYRVLKKRGRIFISTTGSENSILKNCDTLGNHIYKIKRDDTFRKEETYFYFDNESYIRFYFSKYFEDIKIGRTKTNLFSECLDWFLITGIKK